MNKRILITGASGMLGKYLANKLSSKNIVFGIGKDKVNITSFTYKSFDLNNPSYEKILSWSNPDIIIHCAAITDGNYCEENFSDAFSVNAFSTKKLIDASKSNVKFIYISTDAVFGGDCKSNSENDYVNPKNNYAKSKELSEFFLFNSEKNFLIIRTTIIGFSDYNKSFLDWIVESSINNQDIKLFSDVIFNPITIWELSEEIQFLIENDKFERTIFHIAGSENITKYDFGLKLLKELKLNYKNVDQGSINDFKKRAKRAGDQTLSVSLYQKRFNKVLPNINKSLETIKKFYYEKY